MISSRFLSIIRTTCLRSVCLQRIVCDEGQLSADWTKAKPKLSTQQVNLKVQPSVYLPLLVIMQHPASDVCKKGGVAFRSGEDGGDDDDPAGSKQQEDNNATKLTSDQRDRLNMEVQKDPKDPEPKSLGKLMKKRRRWEKRKQTKKKLKSNETSDNLMSELPFALSSPTTWKTLGFTSSDSTQMKRKRGNSAGRVDSEEGGGEKKKKKENQRPNYFLSIPITNKQISTAAADIQEAVLQQEPRLAKAMIPIPTLHITLLVTHLANQEQVDLAATTLAQAEAAVADLLGGRGLVLPFAGISHFRKEVVFLGLTVGQHRRTLDNLAELLRRRFEEQGLLQGDCRGFEPHLTIMKLSRASKLRSQGIKRVDPALYSDYTNKNFGDQTVERLDLCSMLKKKQPGGYYHTETSLQLGGHRRSQPNDAELLKVSRQLVDDAISRAMQQYKQETLQNGGGPNAATGPPPGNTEDTTTKTDTTANSITDNRV